VLNRVIEAVFGRRTVVFGAGEGIIISSREEHKHKAKVLSDVVRLVLVEEP
jgi:hypothetical protein